MASWQQADVDALYAQMQRAQTELGKSADKALADTGSYIGHALAAATRVAPKLRKVVKNPHPDAKTDGRRAKYGVYKFKTAKDGDKYSVDSERVFVPIYRTGEFGKVRFKSKTTGEYLVREQDGTVRRQEITLGDTEFSTPGIMESPKRRIGRSGLAKKSWQWTARHTLTGGRGQVHDVPAAVEIQWARTGKVIMLRIINYLRYMEKALVGGRQSVDTTVQRATNKMRNAIDKRVAEIAQKANKAA
jgi:hypothetical protein